MTRLRPAAIRRHTLPLFIVFLLVYILGSCHKTGSGTSNIPPGTYLLSSVKSWASHGELIDSFSYDSNRNLVRYAQYSFDTSSGSPVVDSMLTDFTFAGASPLPVSYHTYDIPAAYNEVHVISYDAQNRVVRDSSTSGSGFVNHISYPGNNVASLLLFDGTQANNQVDTMFFSNGNMTSYDVYYPNNAGTADSLSGAPAFGFFSLANPAYVPKIAHSIGPILYFLSYDGYGSYSDYMSKNLISKVTAIPNQWAVNFNISTDSKGRASLMTAQGATGSAVIRFYYY